MHLWDDTQEMHGPVECGGVLHRFGPEGFFTTALPRLTTKLRGADAAMDTAWMGFANEYYAFMGWLSRLGSGLGSAAGLAARGAVFRGVGRYGGRALARAGAGLGIGGAGLLRRGVTGLFALDVIYTALNYLYEGGQEKAQHFVGVMAGERPVGVHPHGITMYVSPSRRMPEYWHVGSNTPPRLIAGKRRACRIKSCIITTCLVSYRPGRQLKQPAWQHL
jgi:hypothetical protein